MKPEPSIDPHHELTRATVSRAGMIMMAVGIGVGLTGLWMFAGPLFSDNPFDLSFGRAASGMFLAFIGFFLTAVSLQLLFLGNAGRILRYQAGEALPVAHDVMRHSAPLAGHLAREVARSAREGWGEGSTTTARLQHSCGAWNDPDDRFCKGCGQSLTGLVCPSCQTQNDPDARFCDRCGARLAGPIST